MIFAEAAELLLGIVVGVLLTAMLSFPRVGRALGKALAVGLIALGAGLLTWGFFAYFGERFEPLKMGPVTFWNSSQTLGWGVGCLAGGITALVLSFTGKVK